MTSRKRPYKRRKRRDTGSTTQSRRYLRCKRCQAIHVPQVAWSHEFGKSILTATCPCCGHREKLSQTSPWFELAARASQDLLAHFWAA